MSEAKVKKMRPSDIRKRILSIVEDIEIPKVNEYGGFNPFDCELCNLFLKRMVNGSPCLGCPLVYEGRPRCTVIIKKCLKMNRETFRSFRYYCYTILRDHPWTYDGFDYKELWDYFHKVFIFVGKEQLSKWKKL